MNLFLQAGIVKDFTTSTTQLAPIPYQPPLLFEWFPLLMAFMFGVLLGVFLMGYLDEREEKHQNGKLIIQGGKFYRIRYHEIELKEKE